MRGDATTSLRKTTRGRRSERTTKDNGSGNDNCSDNSNGNSNGDGDSGNDDSGDKNSNSNSGSSNSNSSGKNNNQLKPAEEKLVTKVDGTILTRAMFCQKKILDFCFPKKPTMSAGRW